MIIVSNIAVGVATVLALLGWSVTAVAIADRCWDGARGAASFATLFTLIAVFQWLDGP